MGTTPARALTGLQQVFCHTIWCSGGTTQLVLGNVVLMKNDAYQGKRKVKDWWSETEYVVVHQVTDGVPAYEVKDEAGRKC